MEGVNLGTAEAPTTPPAEVPPNYEILVRNCIKFKNGLCLHCNWHRRARLSHMLDQNRLCPGWKQRETKRWKGCRGKWRRSSHNHVLGVLIAL